MKLKIVAPLLGIFLLTAAAAQALGPLDIDADLGAHSKYVWRGQIVTDDAVLQPSLGVGILGFHVGGWGNIDMTDAHDQKWEFNELDWTIGYDLSLPLVSLGAGFIYYDFPTPDLPALPLGNDTAEFYLQAKANVLLSPRLAVYQDLDKYKGAYWSAGVTYGSKLGESVGLDISADLGFGSKGYQEGYFGAGLVDEAAAGFSDFLLRAELPWHVIPFLTITPHVSWSTLLGDSKTAYENVDADTNTAIYGLTASFSF